MIASNVVEITVQGCSREYITSEALMLVTSTKYVTFYNCFTNTLAAFQRPRE